MLPMIIEPESLKIIEVYLENGSDIGETALALGVSKELVASHLNKKESRDYLNTLFVNAGFRNREKFFDLMDAIIDKKLEEAEDSGIYSNLDLVELLEKMHKMKMAEISMEIKLAESQKAHAPTNQTNIQINGGDNYQKLLDKLITGGKK